MASTTTNMAQDTARAAGLPESAAIAIAEEWDLGSSTEEAIGYAAAACGCDAGAAVSAWQGAMNAPLTADERARAVRFFG